jgi:ABC-type Fe3+/spermidine/putrescine transport system ATPase subunit
VNPVDGAGQIRGGAITIERLHKRYGAAVAVHDVSMQVRAGEFLTLLGASGSGKTTTLMMVGGFVHPDSGAILLDGHDISQLPPERRGLGVVFQSYALFPHLNVFDNVAFPLRLRRMPRAAIKQRVDGMLDLVSLGEQRLRRVTQLSGGQQQRVALARALAAEPPVLLMDEPLAALDRQLRAQMQTEIKRVQRELGVTVIYVTHDQEEALALSDRVGVMAKGRLLQLDTPDQVYERPVSLDVACFLGESNLIRGRASLDGSAGAMLRCAASGVTLTGIRGDLTQPGDAVAAIRPEAVHVGQPHQSAFANAGRGMIVDREFLGSALRLSVRSEFGLLTIRMPRGADSALLHMGQEICVSWRPEDMTVFASI